MTSYGFFRNVTGCSYFRGKPPCPSREVDDTEVFMSVRNFSTLLSSPVIHLVSVFVAHIDDLARKMSVICMTSAPCFGIDRDFDGTSSRSTYSPSRKVLDLQMSGSLFSCLTIAQAGWRRPGA